MTKAQARKRIDEMENEYALSETWPKSMQDEYERLCEIIHGGRRTPTSRTSSPQ